MYVLLVSLKNIGHTGQHSNNEVSILLYTTYLLTSLSTGMLSDIICNYAKIKQLTFD